MISTRNSLFLKFFALAFLIMASASCCKHGKGEIGKTVIVYFAANNSLSSHAVSNIQDMKSGYIPDYFEKGESGDVLLVYAHFRDSGKHPKLMRLSKDKFGDINEEILKEYDDHNSANDSVMHSVLKYAYDLFPAKENGLILWSHGTGWLPKGYYSTPTSVIGSGGVTPQAYVEEYDPYDYLVKSFAEENGSEIEITDLAKAMPIKYSYIIFDACLMGGVEIAYEFKDKADYQIFSAAEIMATGFPYASLMRKLMYDSGSLTARLQSASADFYDYYYKGQGSKSSQSATIALVRSYDLPELAEAAKNIFETYRNDISKLDVTQIQGFFRKNKHWYYDLDDYLYKLTSISSGVVDSKLYTSFSNAIGKAVLYKAATPYFMKGSPSGFEIKKYSGFSSYIPYPSNTTLDTHYKKLEWNKAVEMVE